jgi:hypothetical protein
LLCNSFIAHKKRRIPPERYVKFWLKLFEKIIKYIFKKYGYLVI